MASRSSNAPTAVDPAVATTAMTGRRSAARASARACGSMAWRASAATGTHAAEPSPSCDAARDTE